MSVIFEPVAGFVQFFVQIGNNGFFEVNFIRTGGFVSPVVNEGFEFIFFSLGFLDDSVGVGDFEFVVSLFFEEFGGDVVEVGNLTFDGSGSGFGGDFGFVFVFFFFFDFFVVLFVSFFFFDFGFFDFFLDFVSFNQNTFG